MILGAAPLQTRQQFTDGEVLRDVERRIVLSPFGQLLFALHFDQLAEHHLHVCRQ